MESIVAYTLLLGATLAPWWSYAIRGRRGLGYVTGFSIPLAGLDFAIGSVSLSVTQLVVASSVLRLLASRKRVSVPGLALLVAILLYSASLALWHLAPGSPTRPLIDAAARLGWGAGQTEMRFVVQWLSMLLAVATVWVAFHAYAQPNESTGGLRAYVHGSLLSAIVGFYQVTAQGLGLPYISPETVGRNLQGYLGVRDVVLTGVFFGQELPRLYGLGGEPKHTAALISLALVAVIFFPSGKSVMRSRKATYMSVGVLFCALILTFSTSGWITFLASSAAMLLIRSKNRQRRPPRWAQVAAVSVVLLSFGLVLSLSGALDSRVISRLGGVGGAAHFEFKDAAYLNLVGDSPLQAAIGFGPGGVDFHLLPRVVMLLSASLEDATVTPAFALTRLASDWGLVGLSIFVALLLSWFMRARRSSDPAALHHVGLGCLVIGLGNFATLPAAMWLVGLGLSATSELGEGRSAGTANRNRPVDRSALAGRVMMTEHRL